MKIFPAVDNLTNRKFSTSSSDKFVNIFKQHMQLGGVLGDEPLFDISFSVDDFPEGTTIKAVNRKYFDVDSYNIFITLPIHIKGELRTPFSSDEEKGAFNCLKEYVSGKLKAFDVDIFRAYPHVAKDSLFYKVSLDFTQVGDGVSVNVQFEFDTPKEKTLGNFITKVTPHLNYYNTFFPQEAAFYLEPEKPDSFGESFFENELGEAYNVKVGNVDGIAIAVNATVIDDNVEWGPETWYKYDRLTLALFEPLAELATSLGLSSLKLDSYKWWSYYSPSSPLILLDYDNGKTWLIGLSGDLKENLKELNMVFQMVSKWSSEHIQAAVDFMNSDLNVLEKEKPLSFSAENKAVLYRGCDSALEEIVCMSPQSTIADIRAERLLNKDKSYFLSLSCSSRLTPAHTALTQDTIEIADSEDSDFPGITLLFNIDINSLRDRVKDRNFEVAHAALKSAIGKRSDEINDFFESEALIIPGRDSDSFGQLYCPSIRPWNGNSLTITYSEPYSKCFTTTVTSLADKFSELRKLLEPAFDDAKEIIAKENGNGKGGSYTLNKLKGQAATLKKSMAEEGVKITTAQAQKMVAKMNLQPNWQTLIANASK